MGLPKISFAHRVKRSVKHAVKFVSDFEKHSVRMGLRKGVDVVVCGHIHQPLIEKVENEDGSIMYMNSGDWIENMTALEFVNSKWTLYRYGIGEDAVLDEYLTQLEQDQYIFPGTKKAKEKDLDF